MDTLTSSEFRRRYASLTKPTTVTVLGRSIGVWLPGSTPDERLRYEAGSLEVKVDGQPLDHFNTKPFRPVPKRR